MNHQSLDIKRTVDQTDGAIGAGDQGLMFGYARMRRLGGCRCRS